MHPILFKFGPITVYTYGFFIFLAVLCGYTIAGQRAKKAGIDANVFSNICFWMIIFGFLGAKLLYLMVEWRYFLDNPLSLVRSGFVFYGGFISGGLALFFLAKKHGFSFFELADLITPGIPLAHALGRIGCFFYGCCYGRPTQAWYGIVFPLSSPAGLSRLPIIPTQLISAAGLVVIFFIIAGLSKHKTFPGKIFVTYFLIYGVFRFLIEFLRGDPRGRVFFLSVSQFVSLGIVLASILVINRLRKHI